MNRLNHRKGLARAVGIAGGQAALARLIGDGIRQSTVWHWLNRTAVPGNYAKIIHEKTGVPLHELRPDLWDAPPRP